MKQNERERKMSKIRSILIIYIIISIVSTKNEKEDVERFNLINSICYFNLELLLLLRNKTNNLFVNFNYLYY